MSVIEGEKEHKNGRKRAENKNRERSTNKNE